MEPEWNPIHNEMELEWNPIRIEMELEWNRNRTQFVMKQNWNGTHFIMDGTGTELEWNPIRNEMELEWNRNRTGMEELNSFQLWGGAGFHRANQRAPQCIAAFSNETGQSATFRFRPL